jgi:hypothetical protein
VIGDGILAPNTFRPAPCPPANEGLVHTDDRDGTTPTAAIEFRGCNAMFHAHAFDQVGVGCILYLLNVKLCKSEGDT